MKHWYYSIFRKDYAYKGLLLYQSLKKWDSDFHLYICYFQEEVREFYEKLNLKDATLINLKEEEGAARGRADQGAEPNRNDHAVPDTPREAKNAACLHLLKRYPEITHLVWLDGDTFFCADPGPLFKARDSAGGEIQGAKI